MLDYRPRYRARSICPEPGWAHQTSCPRTAGAQPLPSPNRPESSRRAIYSGRVITWRATDDVDVWMLRLALPRTLTQPASGTPFDWALTQEDRARVDALVEAADRLRLAASRALLRHALAETTGIPTDDQRFFRRCDVCGGPHGKPRLVPPGLDLPTAAADRAQISTASWATPNANISHSGDVVVLALHATRPVGVDVEEIGGADFAGFEQVALTPGEARQLAALPETDGPAARTRWWVRKEAILKATGHGLAVEPSRLAVSAPHERPRLLTWSVPGTPAPEVALADVPLDGPYAATVAALGRSRIAVTLHQVSAAELARA